MSTTSATPVRTRRRWLQFRLRTLLIAVTVIAGLLALTTNLLLPQWRERQAREVLEAGGAEFETMAAGPEWLADWLGEYRPFHITKVEWVDATDEGLLCLRGLGQLRELSLYGELTDVGLTNLARLPSLRTLDVLGERITDVGIARFVGLPAIESLSLQQTSISDEGLRHLRGLIRLKELDLLDTQVTGVGLAHLQELPALGSLWLGSTHVDDCDTTEAGLAQLRRLPKLEELRLYGATLTKSGWDHLAALRNLQYLELERVESPDGWEHMQGLTQVQSLRISPVPSPFFALTYVGSLKNLRELSIAVPVTDEQVAHLERLPNLRFLSLECNSDCPASLRRLRGLKELELHVDATESWLALLAEMKGLEKVVLDRSSVTAGQLEMLRQSRPDLEIVLETLRFGQGGGGFGGGGGGAL